MLEAREFVNRIEKIRAHLDLRGKGLEIGPSFRPAASKREGFDVDIVDHLTAEELRAKYRDARDVDLSLIEEVDYVWQGERYSELIGEEARYHWIIASHVIEHSPDLIAFLNDCSRMLTEDGRLSLVVPDMRYCFDHHRMPSSIAQVIDAHLQGRRIHSAGALVDYFLNVVSKGDRIAWAPGSSGRYRFSHGTELARDFLDRARAGIGYVDIHGWCFTPSSFRLLLHDLRSLELVDLDEVGFFDTEGSEFFVTLGRSAQPPGAVDRMALLEGFRREYAEG